MFRCRVTGENREDEESKREGERKSISSEWEIYYRAEQAKVKKQKLELKMREESDRARERERDGESRFALHHKFLRNNNKCYYKFKRK